MVKIIACTVQYGTCIKVRKVEMNAWINNMSCNTKFLNQEIL